MSGWIFARPQKGVVRHAEPRYSSAMGRPLVLDRYLG